MINNIFCIDHYHIPHFLLFLPSNPILKRIRYAKQSNTGCSGKESATAA